MARIAGVNLPLNKRVVIGLTYVYGIGDSTAVAILEEVGVNPDTQVKDLTEDEAVKLRHDAAMKWLGDVSAGRAHVSGGNTTPTATRHARASSPRTGSDDRRGW
jgi:ribosomal protein S13